eukprot:s2125_g8.t1
MSAGTGACEKSQCGEEAGCEPAPDVCAVPRATGDLNWTRSAASLAAMPRWPSDWWPQRSPAGPSLSRLWSPRGRARTRSRSSRSSWPLSPSPAEAYQPYPTPRTL